MLTTGCQCKLRGHMFRFDRARTWAARKKARQNWIQVKNPTCPFVTSLVSKCVFIWPQDWRREETCAKRHSCTWKRFAKTNCILGRAQKTAWCNSGYTHSAAASICISLQLITHILHRFSYIVTLISEWSTNKGLLSSPSLVPPCLDPHFCAIMKSLNILHACRPLIRWAKKHVAPKDGPRVCPSKILQENVLFIRNIIQRWYVYSLYALRHTSRIVLLGLLALALSVYVKTAFKEFGKTRFSVTGKSSSSERHGSSQNIAIDASTPPKQSSAYTSNVSIAIVTAFHLPKQEQLQAGDYVRMLGETTSNMWIYGRKHNIPVFLVNRDIFQADRQSSWVKIPLYFRYFAMGYDWVFYTDVDWLFTDFSKDLRSLVSLNVNSFTADDISSQSTSVKAGQQVEMVVSRECIGSLGTKMSGTMMLRNSPWSKNFLRKWNNLYTKFKTSKNHDQDAFAHLTEVRLIVCR